MPGQESDEQPVGVQCARRVKAGPASSSSRSSSGWHAHLGWLFDGERTDAARFVPDLIADRDLAWTSRQFPFWTVVSLLAPALLVIHAFEQLGWAYEIRWPTIAWLEAARPQAR